MIELTSNTSGDPPEMVDLFSIDGVTYQVPKTPRVNIGLQYLRDARDYGPATAEMMLLEKMVGEKGYQALCEFDDLDPDDLRKVTDVVVRLALGRLEDAEAPNPGRGSPKSDGSSTT